MSEDETLIQEKCKENNVEVAIGFYKQITAESTAFRTLYRWAMDGESGENIKQQLIGMGGLLYELANTDGI